MGDGAAREDADGGRRSAPDGHGVIVGIKWIVCPDVVKKLHARS